MERVDRENIKKSRESKTMSNTKTLQGRRSKENVSLRDAISACNAFLGNNAIALLYSPTACQLAQLVDGKLSDSEGKEIALESIFEARIFNTSSELRWLNVLNGNGNAVIISESDISGIFETDCNLQYLETLSQQYVLWGAGMESPNNASPAWSRLGAARVGAMDVPIAGITTSDRRCILKVTEYLQEVDNHGNVAVVEERLVQLKSFSKK